MSGQDKVAYTTDGKPIIMLDGEPTVVVLKSEREEGDQANQRTYEEMEMMEC